DADSFSLTISPPLFQLTVTPGEAWSSNIKVLNNNPYDIDVYASAMNFEAKGEGGASRFIPLSGSATTSYSLASWLSVPKGPIHIPAEKSGMVPFTLHVPKNAEPGGHYGALQIGNQPNADLKGNIVKVSSAITSLFLVRVNGEMVEKGDIREFSLDKQIFQEPKVNFTLRFQNKGNVHLLPRGEIAIYNMWGKERGKILVNQDSDFGNVLPSTIRNFAFEWSGENNFFEVGRYRAVATLQFGDAGKETVYRELSFWVIPFGPASKILGFLVLFIAFFAWSIKRYIRRALALETERMAARQGVHPEELSRNDHYQKDTQKTPAVPPSKIAAQELKAETLVRPLALGALDLRNAISKTPTGPSNNGRPGKKREVLTLSKFAYNYRIFLICFILILIGIYGIRAYFDQVLTTQRNFEVKEQREDRATVKTTPESQVKEGDIKL
ncbi:MAG: hypothetical protein WCT49_06530, partial [Candidatus Paceibacterota bacterium]